MKKTRFIAFLLALLMMISVFTTVSAEIRLIQNQPVDNAMSWNSPKYVANKDSLSFYLMPWAWCLFEKEGNHFVQYEDLIYDCSGPVKATTTASWIRIDNLNGGFILGFEENYTEKNRTGKVTVTGSGYKATLKFTQFTQDSAVSVKRKKNKVTVKLKFGTAPAHYVYVWEYMKDTDGKDLNKTLLSNQIKKNTFTFKVRAGRRYDISFGPAVPTEWGYSYSTSYIGPFEIKTVKGSETLYPYPN